MGALYLAITGTRQRTESDGHPAIRRVIRHLGGDTRGDVERWNDMQRNPSDVLTMLHAAARAVR